MEILEDGEIMYLHKDIKRLYWKEDNLPISRKKMYKCYYDKELDEVMYSKEECSERFLELLSRYKRYSGFGYKKLITDADYEGYS
jgi:hypothetical protein